MADMTQFPASQNFAGAIVYAAPNSLRQMHWHVLADEWEYVINGTIEVVLLTNISSISQLTACTTAMVLN